MNTTDIDIRWKQRLSNLTRAKNMLDAIREQELQDMGYVQIAGWIHIFDLVFELSWKTLRDYMLAQWESESMNFTREVLTIALARGLITDGDIWIEMLADRNSSTHEYNETAAEDVIRHIQQKYISLLHTLHVTLTGLS